MNRIDHLDSVTISCTGLVHIRFITEWRVQSKYVFLGLHASCTLMQHCNHIVLLNLGNNQQVLTIPSPKEFPLPLEMVIFTQFQELGVARSWFL